MPDADLKNLTTMDAHTETKPEAPQRCLALTAELPEADEHCLKGIQGWFELSNPSAAAAEFMQINPAYTFHPKVAYARCRILLRLKAYGPLTHALEFFEKCIPNDVRFVVVRAIMLHRTGYASKAYKLLRPYLDAVPDTPAVPYNLACFLANLGRLRASASLLQRALTLKNAAHWIRIAPTDPDLEPLRQAGLI